MFSNPFCKLALCPPDSILREKFVVWTHLASTVKDICLIDHDKLGLGRCGLRLKNTGALLPSLNDTRENHNLGIAM